MQMRWAGIEQRGNWPFCSLMSLENGNVFLTLAAAAGDSRCLWPSAGMTVVDISEDALRLVRGLNNPRISTRHADFLVQTFENAFDVAIAIESIQYFTLMTLEGVFAKIRSVLRPGGRFVFTELNSQSWRYALHALRGRH